MINIAAFRSIGLSVDAVFCFHVLSFSSRNDFICSVCFSIASCIPLSTSSEFWKKTKVKKGYAVVINHVCRLGCYTVAVVFTFYSHLFLVLSLLRYYHYYPLLSTANTFLAVDFRNPNPIEIWVWIKDIISRKFFFLLGGGG